MKIAALPALFLLIACPSCQQPKIHKSQLETRQIQTREYEIKDPKRALKAVLNVLQDDDFIPRQADLELGYVYAVKETDMTNNGEIFWSKFWHGKNARWPQNSIIECAANVTEIRNGMRLRVNFQVKVMNNRGEVAKVESIGDPTFYQNFFQQVDKGVFYELEGV